LPTVSIRQFEESFVVHFGSNFERINAYTLASSLVALADAAKAANAAINPGFEIEVVVEALGPGSFKAKIRAFYKSASNLFTTDNAKAIVLGVIASYIFQVAFAPDQQVKVVVNTDEVLIQQGDKTIVVPREVHQAVQEVRKSPDFQESIGRAFEAVEKDPNISSVGIASSFDEPTPLIEVPRERFASIASSAAHANEETREIIETTELQIMRAILERSRRRWEFVWRGVRISAPVLDDRFFADFAAHRITIAPGDALEVKLKIRQRRDPYSGIMLNDANGYEVLQVIKHLPRHRQTDLSDGSADEGDDDT
jgi:hypothetical protein